MPVPSAVISVPISWLDSILSKRARSTLRILPRSGSTAWKARSRPCLAEPPAESPSTSRISHFDGSRSWQSASLPGSDATSSAPLRRVSSRALRAASRAAAASTTLPTTSWPRRMLLEPVLSASLMTFSTAGRTSEETSLSFVCDENFGSGTFTETIGGQALAAIVAGERDLLLLGQAGRLGVAGDLAGQRRAEAGEVRAAVALRDVVGEAEHVLVVGVVPPQRDLDADAVALGADHDGRRTSGVLARSR